MKNREVATIRAKSVLKIDTGCGSNLDYEYQKGAGLEGIMKNMIHGVLFNKGKTKASKIIQEFLDGYEDGFRD